MERKRLAGFGIVFGLLVLSGCVEPAVPGVVALGPAPVAVPMAPAPVALVPPPQVWAPKHHVARVHRATPVHHVAVRRHWVKRYHSAQLRTPQCGSVAHSCNKEHVETPFP